MKIKPEHYAVLKTTLAPLDTPERRAKYKSKGVSAMRYRWDLLYESGLTPYICDTLYKYMNDDHLDTALRNIVAFEYNF